MAKSYKQKYLKFFQYGHDEFVPDEIDGSQAMDIHHVRFRSTSHKNQHSIFNIMAINRENHNRCHSRYITEEQAQFHHDEFVIRFLISNREKLKELDKTSLEYYSSKLIESDPYKSIIK